MKNIVTLAAILLSATLSGCVTTQASRADAETDVWKASLPAQGADYGAYPNQYQEIIKGYMAETLKDPDSAKYADFTLPRQEHVITNAPMKQAAYGYSSCVKVNAKNSYGGYTGSQLHWFFIKDGAVVRSQNASRGRSMIYLGRAVNCNDGPRKG